MSAAIHVKGLTVFQGSTPILQDINFVINRGEFVFLTGETGSGKTSLLKTLYADLPLKIGEVRVADFDLHTIEKHQIPFLRRRLGIVFQDFQLLMDRDVEENLCFVLRAIGWRRKKMMKQKIEEVLTKVGLGWANLKMAHQLSGGEQQRIAIARSLLSDPLIILADEPTGNLDLGIAREILQLFVDINRGGTAVLMATHNHGLLEQHSTRTLRCHRGALLQVHPTTEPYTKAHDNAVMGNVQHHTMYYA